MFRKLAMFTAVALAMLFSLTGAGHQIESQSNSMTCWAENKSYPTTCAEEDNVPIFGPQVSSFWVVATHPTYTIGVDNCAPDFSGCPPLATPSSSDNRPLLALMGRVLVKVTDENGPIRPGDLLVSSNKVGHAMRCPEPKACEGAIIGKALEPLEEHTGFILMLVMR